MHCYIPKIVLFIKVLRRCYPFLHAFLVHLWIPTMGRKWLLPFFSPRKILTCLTERSMVMIMAVPIWHLPITYSIQNWSFSGLYGRLKWICIWKGWPRRTISLRLKYLLVWCSCLLISYSRLNKRISWTSRTSRNKEMETVIIYILTTIHWDTFGWGTASYSRKAIYNSNKWISIILRCH